MAKQPTTRKTSPQAARAQRQARSAEVFGLLWLALGLFVLVCLAVGGSAGVIGQALRTALYGCFGAAAWLVFAGLVSLGFVMIREGRRDVWKLDRRKVVLYGLLVTAVVILYHLLLAGNPVERSGSWWQAIVDGYNRCAQEGFYLGAGAVGGALCWPLCWGVGLIASYIFAAALLIGSIVLLFNLSLGRAARGIDRTARAAGDVVQTHVRTANQRHREARMQRRAMESEEAADTQLELKPLSPEEQAGPQLENIDFPQSQPAQPQEADFAFEQQPEGRQAGGAQLPGNDMLSQREQPAEAPLQPLLQPQEWERTLNAQSQNAADEDDGDIWKAVAAAAEREKAAQTAVDAPPPPEDAPPEVDWDTLLADGGTAVLDEQGNLVPVAAAKTGTPSTMKPGEIRRVRPRKVQYKLPSSNLLQRAAPPPPGESVNEKARLLEQTLAEFDVQAKVVSVSRGPTITRFELQPATGVRVSKIAGLTDDIAMRLATAGVRIEAPVPGKSVVGIEVPNRQVEVVALRSIIDSPEFARVQRLPVALGKDIAGNPVVADLTRMPHVLIAGQTGSGKSVCINSILLSLMYRVTPQEMRLILIDPKIVELASYRGIPHLLTPVVTDPKKAAGSLAWAVAEMEKRYHSFSQYGVREIERYNEKRLAAGEEKLPYLVVVVDEMADLMMVAPKDVEESICRIAQLGRAAGIHLIVATQRPSVNVITGVIKANLPSRIAFATASQVDSRTILDHAGAEKLLGRGDMLFCASGMSKAQRAQGCYVSDAEVDAVVEWVKSQVDEVEYDETIAEHTVAAPEKEEGPMTDTLLPQAILLVAETGQASTSLLQRRMGVGYARAGRMIDIMERQGYIGPAEGTKPRAVLVSREVALSLQKQADGAE